MRTLAFSLAALLGATPALAQSVVISETASAPRTQALSPSLGQTEILPLITPATAETLIATPTIQPAQAPSVLDTLPRISAEDIATIAPLQVDPNAESAEEEVSLYVIEDGTILPADVWSARDSAACKAAGGVELPLPANRIGCFKL